MSVTRNQKTFSTRKTRRVSLGGVENATSAREYTRESFGDEERKQRQWKKRRRNRRRRRNKERRRERAADKWPSRQTRDRSERARPVTCQSANSCWSRRPSERTRCRARQNGRREGPEGRVGERRTREGERGKKSYESRGRGRARSEYRVQSARLVPVLSPKQRLARNLSACRVVAMPPLVVPRRCT